MFRQFLLSSILSVGLFSINSLSAQDYQPFPTECAKWEVYRCFYFYSPGWHDKYTITLDGSDTVYMGDTYKKLNIIQHTLPGTIYDSLHPSTFFGGMREANKKVYIFQMWASVDTLPNLVYDFTNTNLGDTIYTKALHGSPTYFGHVVNAVDSVLVGKKYHKRLDLRDPKNSANQEYWIEGIGSSWGLPWATFWSATDNSYDLSCYNTVNKVVYENPNPTFGMCAGTLPVIKCDSSSDCDTVSNCKLNLGVVQTGNQLKSAQDSASYQWIDCDGMIAINGATGQTYTATQNGLYAVIVTKGDCIDTSACTEVFGMGISRMKGAEIKVYPIPSDGLIQIEFPVELNGLEIKISDLQGQVLILTSLDRALNISLNLPEQKGLYLLQVSSDEGQWQKRVIRR